MKSDKLYLEHILDSFNKIVDFTKEGKSFFLSDTKTQDAVYRNLEIIGEASKRVSVQSREEYPQIPWRRMAGLRDILIHQYDGVDPNEVWIAIERDIPNLKHLIETLIKKST